MGLKFAAECTTLQRQAAQKRQFDELCEQARRQREYNVARIRVAAMTPDERDAARAAINRARVVQWANDPQTVMRLSRRMSGAVIRK